MLYEVITLGERYDLVHEADAASLVCIEALAGLGVAPHLARADRVGELRENDSAGQTPARLGDREHGT